MRWPHSSVRGVNCETTEFQVLVSGFMLGADMTQPHGGHAREGRMRFERKVNQIVERRSFQWLYRAVQMA
jgi:hypothetical protein